MAQHTKWQNAPKFWRPKNIFTTSPLPGAHPKDACIPLGILIRDMLKLTETALETRRVLSSGAVMVDKKVRKEPKLPVGLFDVIEIPGIGKSYRIVPIADGLGIEEIKKSDADHKVCQILDKSTIKKDLFQLNLHDGRCILLPASEAKKYITGDSLLIKLPGQKIEGHIQFKKGAQAVIFAGKNVGITGTVKEIKQRAGMLDRGTVVITSGGKDITTVRDYVMATEAAK